MKNFIINFLFILLFISPLYARIVVIEEFTGTWCPYCYAAGVALDRVEMNYSNSQVMIISYHISDSFSIGCNATRGTYYSIPGYPTVVFNGVNQEVGGYAVTNGEWGVSQMFSVYTDDIKSEQNRTSGASPFDLSAQGSLGPTNPQMTLKITSATGYPRSVTVLFLITEDNISVSATNGQTVLNSVARGYLGSQTFSLTTAGSITLTASYSGTIPCISSNNLHPFIILQDNTTKEIVGGLAAMTQPTGVTNWEIFD